MNPDFRKEAKAERMEGWREGEREEENEGNNVLSLDPGPTEEPVRLKSLIV